MAVVDDGSTDSADNLIGQLQEKSEFPVRYIHKGNGGKHTALNVGIQTICSELTFIVAQIEKLMVKSLI